MHNTISNNRAVICISIIECDWTSNCCLDFNQNYFSKSAKPCSLIIKSKNSNISFFSFYKSSPTYRWLKLHEIVWQPCIAICWSLLQFIENKILINNNSYIDAVWGPPAFTDIIWLLVVDSSLLIIQLSLNDENKDEKQECFHENYNIDYKSTQMNIFIIRFG
jgi:hypothetical protein